MKTKNIMIVGVGGQGSLLASKLLGHLLMEQGYDTACPSGAAAWSPMCATAIG